MTQRARGHELGGTTFKPWPAESSCEFQHYPCVHMRGVAVALLLEQQRLRAVAIQD